MHPFQNIYLFDFARSLLQYEGLWVAACEFWVGGSSSLTSDPMLVLCFWDCGVLATLDHQGGPKHPHCKHTFWWWVRANLYICGTTTTIMMEHFYHLRKFPAAVIFQSSCLVWSWEDLWRLEWDTGLWMWIRLMAALPGLMSWFIAEVRGSCKTP